MSKGTLFGFIAAVCVVLGSILSATDKPLAFVDVPSMIIVIGGTFVALFLSYETGLALKAIRLMGKAFGRHKDSEASLKDEVGQIVRWAYIIQKNGLQGLENEITDDIRANNPFLAYGADLVVTGYTGAEIKTIMEHMMESQAERDRRETDALKKMGGDPSAIGPSMAVALITTFYGIILARLIFIPLATKMSARNDVTMFKNNLQMEGLVLLAERKSPRYIQDKINSFVDLSEQFSIDRDLNSGK